MKKTTAKKLKTETLKPEAPGPLPPPAGQAAAVGQGLANIAAGIKPPKIGD